MIPKAISEAFRTLIESSVAAITGGLEPCGETGGLKFTCTLPVPQPNPEGLPPAASFDVILPATFPYGDPSFVSVDPAVQWFPHQSWDGTICLERDRQYPSAASERLLAFVKGAIDWVTDAAHQRLVQPGDPWELPDFRSDSKAAPIFFLESEATFPAWSSRIGLSGQVDLGAHARAPRGLVGVRFYDEDAVVAAPALSASFCDTSSTSPAEWVLLPALVLERNRRPKTFAELGELAERAGVDMWQRVHHALKRPSVAGHRYLLVGAPIPRTVGKPAVEVHWQPIAFPDALHGLLFAREERRRGAFRRNLIRRVLSGRDIPWGKSANAAAERLLARGSLAPKSRERRICVAGCGALGAPLAEHLVRGGAQDLALFDGQRLDLENLVRHPLVAADVGRNKAQALARRLAGIHPTATITGFPYSLPLVDAPATDLARQALEMADVIIDCTADDMVSRWVGQLGRRTQKLIVSMYVNAGATMLTIIASGRHASCRVVERALRADIGRGAAPFSQEEYDGELEEVVRGTGCWSATFPASHSDMAALVAAAVPIVEALIARERQSHGTALVLRRREVVDSLAPGPLVEIALRKDYR